MELLGEDRAKPSPAPRRKPAATKPISDVDQEPEIPVESPVEDQGDDISPRKGRKKKSALSRLAKHKKVEPEIQEDTAEKPSKLTESIFDIDDLLPDDSNANKEILDDLSSRTKSTISNSKFIDEELKIASDAESELSESRTRKKKSGGLSKRLAKKRASALGSEESLRGAVDEIKEIPEVIPEKDEIVNSAKLSYVPKIDNETGIRLDTSSVFGEEDAALESDDEIIVEESIIKKKQIFNKPDLKGSKTSLNSLTPRPPESPKTVKPNSRKIINRDTPSDYESGSNFGSGASIVEKNLNNNGNKKDEEENGSQTSLNTTQKEVEENYKNILHSATARENIHRIGELNRYTKKLEPIKSRNPPPPLFDRQYMSSQSLRTSYKRDWADIIDQVKNAESLPIAAMKQSDGVSALDSLQSTTALKSISTASARKRNYLVGSIDGKASLLGTEELERYFPDRTLRLMVGTYNMAEKKLPPVNLDDLLLPSRIDYMPDMYVLGVQEMDTDRREWEVKIQETLGPSHVMFHSAIHGSLHLSVFIKRDLLWFCSIPEDDTVTTRAFKMIKTKGAIGICFTIFGTSFLFLGSHFRSDEGQSKDRVEDYKLTIQGIKLPKIVVPNARAPLQEDATSRFDCVFWCGDMNFRIQRDRQQVLDMIKMAENKEHPHYEDLLAGDELLRLRNEGKVFHQFQEGRINFPPSYKFDIGSDHYDTSAKMRIPSYTDRVLFRCKKKNGIACIHYDSVQEIKDSDHKPVYAIFDVMLKPGRDSIPLAAGTFNREVYLEANRRRALHRVVGTTNLHRGVGRKGSKVCIIQ